MSLQPSAPDHPGLPVDGRSVLQWSAMLSAGSIDGEAAIRQTLDAIAGCPDTAVFTAVTGERAATEARAAAKRHRDGRPLSLLDGVPVAYKDLFDLEGLPTAAGSRVLPGEPASRDAGIVTRLAEAGMVCVGKVNMTEFAYSGLGLNPHFGTPENARGAGRAPGGSSSGSGVAVARGLVPVSIGTDTGGSVRIPATFNGIVGYKTSGARWPSDGCFPLSRTLDTVGVLCRSVLDAVLVDAAACGLAAPDIRRGSVEGLRLVVPTNVVMDGLDEAVAANFETALARLAEAGAIVDRRAFPVFDEILAAQAQHVAIVVAEAYALHRERVEGEAASRMDRRVATRIALARSARAGAYEAILAERARLIPKAAAELAGHCLVAYPTVAHVAPAIAALEADDEHFVRVNMKTLRNTALGNFLDWCGVTVPNGTDPDGLPTGFLLSGAPGRDEHLLATALAAEAIIRDA